MDDPVNWDGNEIDVADDYIGFGAGDSIIFDGGFIIE